MSQANGHTITKAKVQIYFERNKYGTVAERKRSGGVSADRMTIK